MSTATVTVISAEQHERLRQLLKDLWHYRELFWTFVERDIKVRYKQTALGVLWVILQPIFMTGAFAGIFGGIARMPTDGLPYVIFYLGALVPWNTFAAALSSSALSMENNAHLISKIYFPRLVVPGAVVCTSFVDFAIGWTLLNIAALWMGYWHWQLVAVTPLLLAIQAMTVLGFGLALAALNAQYRDVKYAVTFLIQIWMLATPVIYPASRLPQWAQDWLFLNPMAGVVTAYRATLQNTPLPWELVGSCALMAVLYLAAGFWFFRKREAKLADIL
ncbi:MAG: ABC transporter permease [Verrucomicrobia bacterium]|nr:ABC transporter permease [Verrucomicrobiota bacterium]